MCEGVFTNLTQGGERADRLGIRLIEGDAREELKSLPSEAVGEDNVYSPLIIEYHQEGE